MDQRATAKYIGYLAEAFERKMYKTFDACPKRIDTAVICNSCPGFSGKSYKNVEGNSLENIMSEHSVDRIVKISAGNVRIKLRCPKIYTMGKLRKRASGGNEPQA